MSIYDLLGEMNLSGAQAPPTEGDLYNPEGLVSNISGSINNRKIVRDHYYQDMKLKNSQPRNGTGYSIRGTGIQRYYDPKDYSFMLDSAIDPRKVRKITDPQHALPSTFTNGSVLEKYQLDKDAYRSYDNNALLEKSYNSYMRANSRLRPVPIEVVEENKKK